MRYLSVFLSGFLLMLSFSFYLDWSIEEEVLGIMVKKVDALSTSKDSASKIETALKLSAFLEQPSTQIFGSEEFSSMKLNMISPSFQSFYFGTGACGTHTLFVSRLLKRMGYKTKIVQQKQHGVFGAHITLVVENENKLILVDPLFNWVFKDSAGKMSDINDVAANWNFYKAKLPVEYDTTFNYQGGWRYTNWDKYGFISRACYATGCWIWDKTTMDNFSLRYYLLGRARYFSLFSLIGCLLTLLIAFRKDFKIATSKLISTKYAKKNIIPIHQELMQSVQNS